MVFDRFCFGYSLLINVNLSLYKPHNFRKVESYRKKTTCVPLIDLLADREKILFSA